MKIVETGLSFGEEGFQKCLDQYEDDLNKCACKEDSDPFCKARAKWRLAKCHKKNNKLWHNADNYSVLNGTGGMWRHDNDVDSAVDALTP